MSKRLVALFAILCALALSACYDSPSTDVSNLVYTDGSGVSAPEYLSNRDCGYSTPLSRGGSSVWLWVFCDSPAWDANGNQLSQPFGFPTNSAAYSDGTGQPSSLPKLVSFLDGSPTRTNISRLITPNGTYPSTSQCNTTGNPPPNYAAKWPTGIVTLPGNDTTTQTVLVFYQNICVSLTGGGYTFFSEGVASLTWSSATPYAKPVANVITDQLFPVSTTHDYYSGTDPSKYTYGQGPVMWSDGNLYTYLCGPNGSCSVARTALSSSVSGAANASHAALGSNWTYLDPSGTWQPFPTTSGQITCAPSTTSACGGGAVAKALTSVVAGNYDSMPRSGVHVSIIAGGGTQLVVMAYAPNNGANGTDGDHAEFTLSNSTPYDSFGSPVKVTYPAAYCTGADHPHGCRVPILHPELYDGSHFGATYYSEDDLHVKNAANQPITTGRLRWGKVCQNQLVNGTTC